MVSLVPKKTNVSLEPLGGVVNRILSYGYDIYPKLAMAHPAIPFTYR